YIEDPLSPGEEKAQAISFEVATPSLESDNAMLDRTTLEALSQRTGGEFIPLHDVKDLPDRIKSKPPEGSARVEQKELWDSPIWLALIAALLGAEWILRKIVRLL